MDVRRMLAALVPEEPSRTLEKASIMQTSSKQPEITAVVCTYNRYDLLRRAVDSLLAQTLDHDRLEIMVIDNSPDPTRAEREKATYDSLGRVRYEIERTPGLSNARNVALRACRSRFISYLDDDAIARPNWLEKVIEGFEAFPSQAGVVGGRIEPIWEAPRPAWLPDSLLGSLTVVNWGGVLRVAAANEWVAGANISFLVEPLRAIGGFPTNLGRVGSGNILLSNEEIQILTEMRKLGLQVIYAPDAIVDHLVEIKRLDQKWMRKRMAWQAVSDFLKNADSSGLDSEGHWRAVTDYFNAVPPRRRTPRGLFDHCEDPAEFDRQIGCIYNVTMSLLEGLDLHPESR